LQGADETGITERLLTAALAARDRAYAPYSGYSVGAALEDEQGRLHAGCNVENASYPVGTCAEAGAIAAMVAGGGTRIRTILVATAGPEPATPCGACRQRIGEFADADTAILSAGPDGIRRRFGIAELLPHPFGPAALAGVEPRP
jgi:cytidine deaminase